MKYTVYTFEDKPKMLIEMGKLNSNISYAGKLKADLRVALKISDKKVKYVAVIQETDNSQSKKLILQNGN